MSSHFSKNGSSKHDLHQDVAIGLIQLSGQKHLKPKTVIIDAPGNLALINRIYALSVDRLDSRWGRDIDSIETTVSSTNTWTYEIRELRRHTDLSFYRMNLPHDLTHRRWRTHHKFDVIQLSPILHS